MAGKKKVDAEEKRTRQLSDYVFEIHHPDGKITPLGITLHYPTDRPTVEKFINDNMEALGYSSEDVLKVCRKNYS